MGTNPSGEIIQNLILNNYIAFFHKVSAKQGKSEENFVPFFHEVMKRLFLKVNLVSKAGRKLNGVPGSSNTLAVIVRGAKREHVIASAHFPRLGP